MTLFIAMKIFKCRFFNVIGKLILSLVNIDKKISIFLSNHYHITQSYEPSGNFSRITAEKKNFFNFLNRKIKILVISN